MAPPESEFLQNEEINPFVTMWTRPRRTLRVILDTDAEAQVHKLAAALGLLEALEWVCFFPAAAGIATAWKLLVIAASPLAGIVVLHVTAFWLAVVGGALGARGERVELRAAIAWSGVVRLAAVLLLVLRLLVVGFTRDADAAASATRVQLDTGFLAGSLVTWGAYVLVLVLNVGEIQRCSAGRTLGSLAAAVGLSALTLGLPLVLVWLALSWSGLAPGG